MARYRKSNLEFFIDLVALLPPWASAALAVLSYFVLHYLSLQQAPSASGMQNAASVLIGTLKQQGANIGQYLVPAIFSLGTVVSVVKRRKRKSLADQTKARRKAKALLDMSWQEFELLLAETFREQGYQVTENSGAGPDGGVDMVLSKGGETFLVQCKQWRAQRVGVEIVRELYGLMAAHGATGGFVVTAGTFTPDATAFAKGRNIVLVNGEQLMEQLSGTTLRATQSASPAQPLCPLCNSSMVQRTARKGPNVGAVFWGYSTYPACKGTRQ